MAELLGTLIGGSAAVIIAVGWLLAILLYLWIPFNVWSAARNIKKMRLQLERLNDILESKGTSSTNKFVA